MNASLLGLLAAPALACAGQFGDSQPVAVTHTAAAWSDGAASSSARVDSVDEAHAGPMVRASPDTWNLNLASGVESLSNGSPNWRESTLQVQRRIEPGHAWGAGATRTSRFGLQDTQVNALYTYKLTGALGATVDGNISSTHRVLPRNAAGVQLDYQVVPALIAQAGIRTTHYDGVRVNQMVLGVDHYVGSFSFNGTWRPTRAFGRTVNPVQMRVTYYYSGASSVALLVAAGREVTPLAGSVTLANVRALAVFGRHMISPQWGITYAANRTIQGNLYTRSGVSVGLQYTF